MADERRPPALLRAWRWIWAPSLRRLHVDACPRCGRTVVVDPGRPERSLTRVPVPPPVDPGQLLAACPEHGWAPFNERSLRLRSRRDDDPGLD